MGEVLYGLMEPVDRIHSYLRRLNDTNEYIFTDKV